MNNNRLWNHFLQLLCMLLLQSAQLLPQDAQADAKCSSCTQLEGDTSTVPPTPDQATAILATSGVQPVDRAAPDLTEEERKLLHAHLATNDSDRKYFVKLIAAIGNQEPRIRAAARKAVRQLLTTNPSLANQKAVACLQRVLRKTNTHQGVNHALQVLDWVVATNPKMAPSVLKLVLDPATLNVALRIVRGDWAKGSDHTPLRTLLRTLVKARPDCKQHILKYVFKRDDLLFDSPNDEYNNVVMRALGILSFIADMEEPGARYFSKMFDTALQASQAVNRYIRSMGVAVFREILHADTQYAKELLATLIQEAQHQDSDTRRHALKALHTFVRADAQYIEAILPVALYNLSSPEMVLWKSSAIIEDVVATNLAKHVQEVFKSVMQLVQHEHYMVRRTAVDALAYFIRPDRQYASTALEALQQAAMEDKDGYVRRHALDSFAAVVKQDAQYAPQALEALQQVVMKDKNKYVRQSALEVLAVVVKQDAQYAPQAFAIAQAAMKYKDYDYPQYVLEVFEAVVHKDAQYAPQAFVIAQQALQNSNYGGKLYAVKVLAAVVHKDIQYAPQAFAIAKQAAKDENNDFSRGFAWELFEAAVKQDAQYALKVLEPAWRAISDGYHLEPLKMNLGMFAAVVGSNPNLISVYDTPEVQVATKVVTMPDFPIDIRTKALEALAAAVNSDARCAPQAFKAALRAMKERYVEMRKQALAVLEAAVNKDAQYAPQAFKAALRVMKEKGWDVGVRKQVLAVLEAVVKKDAQYAQKAGQVAIEATSRRDLDECYWALRVLEAVMAAHAQDQAFWEVLEALSHDEAPQLHQFAHKLLLQYFLKEGGSQ